MNKLDEHVQYAKEQAEKHQGYEKEVFQAILISKLITNQPSKIESPVKVTEKHTKIKETKKKNYSGLAGGIRLLVNDGFFDSPKSVKEANEELKRNAYHYPENSLAKLLSVNFLKNNRILSRMKSDKIWKYVIRK